MYVLIHLTEDGTNKARAYATHGAAWLAMREELFGVLEKDGHEIVTSDDGSDLYDKDDRYLGSLADNEAFAEIPYDRWCIVDVDVPEPKAKPRPEPKLNPCTAGTVAYECKNDPLHRLSLQHQATIRWGSSKSDPVHAPQRIELLVGGTPYEYKAV